MLLRRIRGLAHSALDQRGDRGIGAVGIVAARFDPDFVAPSDPQREHLRPD